MNIEQQLKLQAFLDGELPEKDTRDVAAWLAGDADATALLGELRNTRKALMDFEPELKLPESREFYWSKIKREIERSTPVAEQKQSTSLFARLRSVLLPIGVAATLALAAIITIHQFSGGARPVQVNAVLADAGAFTYRDESQGMTVVWLSYPAEKKLADNPSQATLPSK
jgi:anti-sigma factor RsiW